jgi:putative membrane protein
MYDWLLVLHIAAWTSWMAGLFYLPRLFVYHAERAAGQPAMAETFGVMQHKLLKLIMNPAMIVTWATGVILALGWWDLASSGWLHAKLVLVLAMSAFHGACAKWRKELAAGSSARTGRFFRIANEVPTLLFLAIVALAIVKPF